MIEQETVQGASVLEKNPVRQLADLWKATPTSVNSTSKFFPLKHSLVPSPTFSNISQHARHGSVLTRAKERSSFRGAKSFFFCLANCAESQATIASPEQVISPRERKREIELTVNHPLQKCVRSPLDSTDRLVVEHGHVSPHCNRRTG